MMKLVLLKWRQNSARKLQLIEDEDSVNNFSIKHYFYKYNNLVVQKMTIRHYWMFINKINKIIIGRKMLIQK